MTTYQVLEPRESRLGRWVRPRRLRIALFVGVVETLLVLLNGLGWFVVLGAAIVAVAFHLAAGRNVRFHSVREISWILAVSQLIAVVVPLLWELVKFLAITVLVILALALLVMLLADRRSG